LFGTFEDEKEKKKQKKKKNSRMWRAGEERKKGFYFVCGDNYPTTIPP
jgi:hypothetical protein